jgi:3-deoxy-D-manno-octulosonic acid (KDO) 8-phosphate synthase
LNNPLFLGILKYHFKRISDIVNRDKFQSIGGRTMESKIEVLSTVKVDKSSDLYKVVSELNKTLKHQDLMFGLALDDENKEKMIFTIYRT